MWAHLLSGRVLDSRPSIARSSLTGITGLWSLCKTHLSQLSNGSTQEDTSLLTERLLMGPKESNQTKSNKKKAKNWNIFKRYLLSFRPIHDLMCQDSGEWSRALGPSYCFRKQWRSRSAGFWRSHLIRICTFFPCSLTIHYIFWNHITELAGKQKWNVPY